MTLKGLSISAIAAMGLAFSAFAADGPGVGKGNSNPVSLADIGPLSLVDNYGDTYQLTATTTGGRPKSGSISGTAVACAGVGSYEVDGTFLGATVHLNLNIASSGGNCQSFVIDCVISGPTKTCGGSYTNADGLGGPITIGRN